ncbi:MAG: FtsQ-type POTRA domain-containing protein [Pseudomonadales bacterium]|jgi:cell division protein FtsQ
MDRLVAIVVTLIVGALAVAIYVQLDRPVVRVSVSGQLDDAERAQIREAVRQHLNGGLLSTNLAALSEGILALSWPREVTIRRDWPGTLAIAVEKPAVVAGWKDAYLASDGEVVHLPGRRDDLPRFDCSLAEPRMAMEIYHGLNRSGAADGLVIERLEENELGEWSLTFHVPAADASMTVVLGAESMQERFDRFLVVYRQYLSGQESHIARVDARYDNGVAVSWVPDALVAARGAAGAG